MRPESWVRRVAPTWTALLVYTVICLSLLLLGSYRNWVDTIVQPDIELTITQTIKDKTADFVGTTVEAVNISAPVAGFVFWLIVGSLVYMVGWLVIVAVKDLLNEIEVSLLYVHPRSFSESKHWLGFVTHYLLRLSGLFLLIGYILLLSYVIWPAVLTQFTYGLISISINSLLLDVIPSVLLLIFSLHGLVLLSQLVLWRRSADYWRTYSN